MIALPGDLVSPTAGPILRRGTPVRGPRSPAGPVDIVTHEPNGTHCMTVFEGLVEQAAVSLDLDDPAGMDLAARWLARHHGEKVAITAPAWTYVAAVAGREHRTADGTYIDHDEARPATWLLICDEGTVAFAQWDPDDGPVPTEGGDGVDVWLTDWSDDPAEALALACLAAGGRSCSSPFPSARPVTASSR